MWSVRVIAGGCQSRCAGRIARVGVRQALVAIPEAIAIAIDADALAGAERYTGVRHRVAAAGLALQRRIGDRRLRAAIGPEHPRAHVEEPGLDAEQLGL